MDKQPLNKFAIIVAGGSGTRMKAAIPKQFLLIHGKPILLRTIEQFLKVDGCSIILVLPESEHAFWKKEMNEKYADSIACNNNLITLANGGLTRFQSVTNGLAAIRSTRGVVAIHDGVRPIVTPELIEESFTEAAIYGAVVTSVSLKDSIRKVDEKGNNTAVDRTSYRLIQTPQTFDLQLIKTAYNQQESPLFTDDASVVEAMGNTIRLIEGDYKNIKITTPEDMILAEALCL